MSKLKVTAVSYLNTKPLLYGLVSQGLDKQIDLQLDIPSACAAKLKSGEVDLGLVPVAIIPELEQPHIISDYCIGAEGAVQTVCIFSEVPIENITHLYLDYHSRTSVELAKILVRDYWGIQPTFLAAQPGYEKEIGGAVAGLVIGDRAIGLDAQFAYTYDLGEHWTIHTGLPFVFAAWVSNRPLDPDFVDAFNRAMAEGIAHIPQLIYLLPSPQQNFDLQHYFTHHISYELDAPKRKALAQFLGLITERLQPSLEMSLFA